MIFVNIYSIKIYNFATSGFARPGYPLVSLLFLFKHLSLWLSPQAFENKRKSKDTASILCGETPQNLLQGKFKGNFLPGKFEI